MADLKRIADILGDTPWMRLPLAESLIPLFEKLKPKRIVECGTLHGAGTCYLAELAREYGGHVTTIDLPWTAQESHQPHVETMIARAGLDNVTIIRRDDGTAGWFHDYFAAGLPPIDFAYVDGGHKWQETAASLACVLAALRPGGWFVMDDIANPKYPDVELVWRVMAKRLAVNTYQRGNWGFGMRQAVPGPIPGDD